MRIFTLVAVTSAALLFGCNGEVDKSTGNVVSRHQQDAEVAAAPKPAATSEKIDRTEVATDRPTLTMAQMNALRSAEQYLGLSGFSKKGLIGQLSSDAGDGYALADATAAVNSMSVDWNENAAKSATQYLSISGFSCKGLIQQLSSSAGDNYTVAEATYGAQQAGAC